MTLYTRRLPSEFAGPRSSQTLRLLHLPFSATTLRSPFAGAVLRGRSSVLASPSPPSTFQGGNRVANARHKVCLVLIKLKHLCYMQERKRRKKDMVGKSLSVQIITVKNTILQ